MGTNQKPIPTSINMDARNFLRAINNSAQSKVVFFENIVKRLGQETKRSLKLVALHPTSLMFEDVNTHDYYAGDIKKDGVRYIVENIKYIKVVEEKKADLFDKNCSELVESISESDFKTAEKTFAKIESQRFRSKVIPESGWVTTRDGEARFVNVSDNLPQVDSDLMQRIAKAFADAVSDSVELSEGRIVRGTFLETGDKFVIPIDELARRRIVARHMRNVAVEAYNSPSFQKLVVNIAGLVSQQKVAEAVEMAAKFLKEEQEFCLLNREAMNKLVEATLATQLEFNSFLIEDVTTLIYKTNLKVNKDSIVECWTKTAQKAQNADWLTRVKSMSESKDFGSDYDLFLEELFKESGDINSQRAKAYLVSLKVIKDVLKHIDGHEQLVQDIDQMVTSLSAEEPSTELIYKTEELLAGISDTVIDRIQTLDGFDQMPGVEDEKQAEPEASEDDVPVPLPDLNDEEAGIDMSMTGEAAPAPEMTGAPEAVGAEVGAGVPESKVSKKPVIEGFLPIEKMSLLNLQEELISWKTDGHVYLKEDGFEDCFNQLNRYIDRCSNIGTEATPTREEYEKIRDTVINLGDDVSLDFADPYEGKVEVNAETKIRSDYKPVTEDLGGLSGPEKGAKHSGDNSGMSELQGAGGVVKTDLKKVSGTDAGSAPSNSGEASQEVGLDMSKDHQSKTKGMEAKKLNKASGADAAQVSSNKGEASQEVGLNMSKDHQSKTKGIAEDNFVDRIADAIGEEDLKVGTKHAGGGGYKKPHDIEMDELQGKDGVEDAALKNADGKSASGVPTSKGGPGKQDLDMAKDHQDKTDGLAESSEVAEEVTAEEVVVDEQPNECETATAEDQQKGPRMHQSGRKKAALAPREVKKESKESKPVAEDVAVAYSADERIDDVIAKVVAAMNEVEPDMGMVPPMPTEPAMPPVSMDIPPVDMPPAPELPELEGPGPEVEGEVESDVEGEEPELPELESKKSSGSLTEMAVGTGAVAAVPGVVSEALCPVCKHNNCECGCDPKTGKGCKCEKKESFDQALDGKLSTLTEDGPCVVHKKVNCKECEAFEKHCPKCKMDVDKCKCV